MKFSTFLFYLTLSLFMNFNSVASAQEMSGADSSPSSTGAEVPGPGDTMRNGYEEQCSASQKTQRIEKHNMCKTRFSEMGLERRVNDADIIQKFSCPAIESFWREAAVGCAKYAISLPVDIVRGLGASLGIGRYSAQIERACGRPPQRRMSQRTNSSMPDGQVRYESQSPDQRYQAEVNTYSICHSRVTTALEARAARESANYRSSMLATRRYCMEQNDLIASYMRNSARMRAGSRQDQMIRACQLEALNALNLECSKCVTELSPDTGDIEGSSFFRSMVDSLKQYNPRALQCYNAEKIGELACAAAGAAAGGAGAAIAAAKVARALGRGAADRAIASGKRLMDSETAATSSTAVTPGAQASRAAAHEILDNVDPQRAAAARAAATGPGDSLATRQAYAEAVLNVPAGSLSGPQAQAIWNAHRIADGTRTGNQAKALALRRAGFEDDQVRALMSDEYRVAGGYRGSAANVIDEAVPNSGDNMGLADLSRRLEADDVFVRDGRTGRLPSEVGNNPYWHRDAAIRSDVARNVRTHLDGGGTIANRQQRDEMLRVLAAEAGETTGRAPDYNALARYYERAGRPIDDDFVRYVNQRPQADRLSSIPRFELNAKIGESRMAVNRLRQEASFYSDEMRVRGIDMQPSDGRSRAAAIRAQIEEIERNISMYENLLTN